MSPERWAVLKSLFDRALTVRAEEREVFLGQVCGGDRSLQCSLIDLLNHHEAATSVLAGPMLTPERLVEIVSSGVRTFVPGELLAGRFRILRFMAEGGMGEVYAAEDLDLEETVALKTIRPSLSSDKQVLARFKQEIQLARKVTHRNVSRIFDLFRHDLEVDGVRRTIAFVSMELLEGETLADRIQRLGRLPGAEAQNIALQLLTGLQAAHSAGIIHSDFKSGNIAVVPEPSGGERVVIMDFGLANYRSNLTVDVGLIGTPAFMAPEQVEGGAITPATDIYAFGLVLFEMATGVLPFLGSSPMDTARLRLKQAAPTLRDINPEASVQWERTIKVCLERDPAKRPASAAEIEERLTGRFEKRRQIQALAMSALAIALITGGWFWARQPYRPSRAAQAAVDNALVKLQYRSPAGFREAIADFQRAIKLDPKWAEPWAEIAYTYSDAANTSRDLWSHGKCGSAQSGIGSSSFRWAVRKSVRGLGLGSVLRFR